MKTLFFLVTIIFSFTLSHAQTGGWKQTGYSFTDATKTSTQVLAGTSDYMKDVVQFKGEKGDVEISYNRYDQSSGTLLAGVTYAVKWSNPQNQPVVSRRQNKNAIFIENNFIKNMDSRATNGKIQPGRVWNKSGKCCR
jgi:hypothetical protein